MAGGCRHSSVDSSAPSILPPPGQVPNAPSTLLSIYVDLCHVETTKISQKRCRDWPIFNNKKHLHDSREHGEVRNVSPDDGRKETLVAEVLQVDGQEEGDEAE